MTKPNHQRAGGFKVLIPLYVGLAVLFTVLIRNGKMQLLDPSGTVADFQSKILWSALIFAFIVGSTIIGLFYFVIFHYQEDKGRQYAPTWTTGRAVQLLAWGIPSIVILVISGAVWVTAHAIDPYKPLASTKPAVSVQVVALRWKWLFIYPGDRLATVNYLEIPANTPVNLQLTADAPMSSFWVPSLSGQIYAMPGMVTQLHIQADKTGDYPGSVAEINGDGYSGMVFTVRAVSDTAYDAWRTTAKHTTQTLNYSAYAKLAEPSSYNAPATFAAPDIELFNEIVMQYMAPGTNPSTLQVGGTNL